MSAPAERKNLQGTWKQSIISLVVSVLALLTFRWIVFEPYVIPSGSMIPTLQVLDFIYVNKFAYGLRVPFSSTWLFKRDLPKRCDVAVFRSQTDPGTFLIKRVIGLPGERVELFESGRVRINGKFLATRKLEPGSSESPSDEDHTLYTENCDSGESASGRTHAIQLSNSFAEIESDPIVYAVEVPPDHLVMFGDNRHESADSRVWGPLPSTELLGQALGVWLSCEHSVAGLPRLCDPSSLRFGRMFRSLDGGAK